VSDMPTFDELGPKDQRFFETVLKQVRSEFQARARRESHAAYKALGEDALRAQPLRTLQRRSRLTVRCTDCQAAGLIAFVVDHSGEELLFVRRARGRWETTLSLSSLFWGEFAVCRRGRHFGLERRELADLLAANPARVVASVSHEQVDAVR
jgi:hypothetical protein